MSRRPRNPAPPGRPGPVRKDRATPAGQRPAVWPDVVNTVMLAKFTRQTDALVPGPGDPDAPPEHPGKAPGYSGSRAASMARARCGSPRRAAAGRG